jgi:transcriptional regulator with XRE-family HTH domain
MTTEAPSPEEEIWLEVVDARRQLGLTQVEFANKLGLSRQAVAMWESRRAKIRRAHLLHIRELVRAHQLSVGLRLQRTHRCFCYDAGFQAGRASVRNGAA